MRLCVPCNLGYQGRGAPTLKAAGRRADSPGLAGAITIAAVARVSFGGAHSLTVSGARERKALMDDFRDANARLRTGLPNARSMRARR